MFLFNLLRRFLNLHLLLLPLFLLFVTQSFCANSKIKVFGSDLKLGTVTLNTSTTSPLAQAHFIQGLKYLHNFIYPLASWEFNLAIQADPKFALGYWGLMMSYKHPIWSFENKAKGTEVLKKYRSLKNVKTKPFEKGLIDAVSLIYGPGNLLSREYNYMQAMEKLYHQYPNNVEIMSFYALALLGYSVDAPYDKSTMSYMSKAANILQPYTKSNPDHPGVIHYYIHANDMPNPAVARKGLSVKENVYKYLTDSPHILHMPSHLYTDLGDWPNAAKSNLLSIKADKNFCTYLKNNHIVLDTENVETNQRWSEKTWYSCDADNLYHEIEWLHFEYLQMGQFAKARQLIKEMEKAASVVNETQFKIWVQRMKARQILYTNSLTQPAVLPEPLFEKNDNTKFEAGFAECDSLLANGVLAIHQNQNSLLNLINKRLQTIIDASSTDTFLKPVNEYCLLNKTKLSILKAFNIDHDTKTGLNQLNYALQLQMRIQAYPENFPYRPAQELFGDITDVSDVL